MSCQFASLALNVFGPDSMPRPVASLARQLTAISRLELSIWQILPHTIPDPVFLRGQAGQDQVRGRDPARLSGSLRARPAAVPALRIEGALPQRR